MNNKPAVTFLAKAPNPKASMQAVFMVNLKDSIIFLMLVLAIKFIIGG